FLFSSAAHPAPLSFPTRRSSDLGEAAPGGVKDSFRTWGVSLVLCLPGAVAGGALGSFIVRPVNWALGHFFRAFNWLFERTTRAYGKTVGWGLRLSVIVLLIYVGLIGL